jgi:hypothetical protein
LLEAMRMAGTLREVLARAGWRTRVQRAAPSILRNGSAAENRQVEAPRSPAQQKRKTKMSIYKRGGLYWYEFEFAGSRIRKSAKTKSKTIAREAERVRRRELELGINRITKRARTPCSRSRQRSGCRA